MLTVSGQSQEETINAAKNSAESWLAMVDAGGYRASWERTGKYFKNQMSEEQWQAALRSARSALGSLKIRNLKDTTTTTSLPAAPDGNYVALQFDATFWNEQKVVETVTVIQEPNGIWAIVGYFIRPARS